ncbi:unnamed protein product [Nezara viridula]|uniref:Uncharacterized protein n=1 Tax=Nezara viridula TaxID=85310 RepID=A0A9P0E5V5_NEZVI|nr:unnamed protein product [Nezara viridula]
MILCFGGSLRVSSKIPLQFTRSGQISIGCIRTFRSSSLHRIGPQESLISTQSELERMSYNRAHPNLESLKQSLLRAVERFPQ